MLQLELHEISKRFGGVLANDRISVQVGTGEIVGIIGPNGSGKTTVFNSIVGHHRPDSGRVSFEGRDITGTRVQDTARLGILRTFQQTRIYRDMTCLENMYASLPQRSLRFWDLAGPLPPQAEPRARELLALVNLSEYGDTRAQSLSFGQQRLLELGMVLMSEPKLLLLDEPTAGVTPSLIAMVVTHLHEINRALGITLVVIEHNIPVIMGLADRIYCLDRGRVLAEGTPAQVQADQRVVEAYLGGR